MDFFSSFCSYKFKIIALKTISLGTIQTLEENSQKDIPVRQYC